LIIGKIIEIVATGPRWASLQRSSDVLVGFKGPDF